MEESSSPNAAVKWAGLGLIAFLLIYFVVWPMIRGGSDAPERQPLTKDDWGTVNEEGRADETLCELTGSRSIVTTTSRGAAVKSARMRDAKYAESVEKPDTRIELVSTSRDQRMPLRTSLRSREDVKQQVDYDTLDFKLAESTPTSCTFKFEDASTRIVKVFALTDRPFEVDVTLTVTNLAAEPRTHRYAVEQTSWRSRAETDSSFWDLGRRPPWQTEVMSHTTTDTDRHLPTAFAPDEFDPEEGFTKEHFLRSEGEGVWAGVGTNYFASAVVHVQSSTSGPSAETLVEEGEYYQLSPASPEYGHMYRARLAYPDKELPTGDSATYKSLAYFGPKEREVLAAAGGAELSKKINLPKLIDLGMFGFLGAWLVKYVALLFRLVGSWGVAIALLTISVKIFVFPLMIPSLKTNVAMRRLKPELDEINAKYKDDMILKQQAMSELYRKAGIRPMLGCLPMVLQMPVWIALYQALGTAVELFHTPFLLPLIPDLTHSDPYHVIPIVLGASSFLQQKMMPAQGMDPAQQKMMLFMMPAVFTVMMFFMPAGLGVYMLTNTWVGIVQQFFVERWVSSRAADPKGISVRVVDKSSDKGDGKAEKADKSSSRKDADKRGGNAPALGKGKARARG